MNDKSTGSVINLKTQDRLCLPASKRIVRTVSMDYSYSSPGDWELPHDQSHSKRTQRGASNPQWHVRQNQQRNYGPNLDWQPCTDILLPTLLLALLPPQIHLYKDNFWPFEPIKCLQCKVPSSWRTVRLKKQIGIIYCYLLLKFYPSTCLSVWILVSSLRLKSKKVLPFTQKEASRQYKWHNLLNICERYAIMISVKGEELWNKDY